MRPNDNIRAGGAPVARPLFEAPEWSVGEYVCTAGPNDRPFEERHEQASIAAVIEGSFRYRGDTGTAVLHPGAFLFGNSGTCYECGHDHSAGDRCIAFHFAPAHFAEVAASVAGSGRFRFPAPMLPAMPKLLPWLAWIESRTALADRLAIDEAIPQLMEAVIGTVSVKPPPQTCVSARDERRISDVLRYIELHAGDALDLDTLAAVAIMSKYHFLRTFRQIVGMTPYQFLLGVRMRRAAVRLATSSEPVSTIAFESGFGDLSTFNGRFRDMFGMNPTVYRQCERASRRLR
ncbi:MAG TPA: AraC family transcriptional regulator [Xanthobacteraceae bacterium]|nr:AraC family transcriptional regulator [Xanthobacteraceae bacterium]